MNETAFLDGKVRKKSLPVFHGPPPTGARGPKRLLLPQGELANFYDGEEGIRYIAYMELQPGTLRGNHVHRIKEEWVYLMSGRLLLLIQDGEKGAPISIDVLPGDLITISPGVAHVFKPLEPGKGVEFSPAKFDPTDSQKVVLIN